MPNNSLVLELEKRSKKGDKDAKDFLNQYNTLKVYLEKNYYRFIQANCPYFTDHGEQHIKSVIQTAGLLFGNIKRQLSTLDIFLLLSAIIWHDVGMVSQRSGHASAVVGMIDKVKEIAFPNTPIFRIVVEIIKAHSGKGGLDIPRREDEVSTSAESYTVSTRALAGILRFADEVSENHSRISTVLMPSVPEESRIYWEYASCITASRPEPARERVVVTIEMQTDKATSKFKCSEFKNRLDADGKISLIEYVLSRLEKMNNERHYCYREFSKFASIKEIEVRLTLLKGVERVSGYDNMKIILGDSGLLDESAYPAIDVFEEFFNSNPEWKPEEFIGGAGK